VAGMERGDGGGTEPMATGGGRRHALSPSHRGMGEERGDGLGRLWWNREKEGVGRGQEEKRARPLRGV
jgi:hypothetical protein